MLLSYWVHHREQQWYLRLLYRGPVLQRGILLSLLTNHRRWQCRLLYDRFVAWRDIQLSLRTNDQRFSLRLLLPEHRHFDERAKVLSCRNDAPGHYAVLSDRPRCGLAKCDELLC